jgi:hypothetical protein
MADVFKRPALPLARPDTAGPTKRARLEGQAAVGVGALVPVAGTQQQHRASGLQSPIMLLTGHEGEIFTARFCFVFCQ